MILPLIKRWLLYVIVATSLGCTTEEPNGRSTSIEPFNDVEEGYIPVYSDAVVKEIIWTGARGIKNPGKIYVYQHYLFVNEINEGIHVFDNTNAADPLALGFIQITGNTDIAIKDDVLYADHLGNLVSIGLSLNDLEKVDHRGTLVIQNWERGIPPPAGSYFECIDPTKGVVVSWKKETKKSNYECYAVQ